MSKKSQYKGIRFYEDYELVRSDKNKQWEVSFNHKKERFNLGFYVTEREAAIAHDKFVIKHNLKRKLYILKLKNNEKI